jgi:integrase
MRVRSLAAEVIEALYELLDPESPRNPFRDGSSRWRVYIIFILLLHQGLRRGELLCMSSDGLIVLLTTKRNGSASG